MESFEAFAAAFTDDARPRRGPFEEGAKLGHAVRGYLPQRRARVLGRPRRRPARGGPLAGVLAGLRLLAALDEPTAIAVPDAHGLAGGARSAQVVQRELVARVRARRRAHRARRPPPDLDPGAALAWREQSRIDSATAAAYYPWIEVSDPASGRTTATPPCGHAAGVWARVDDRAGPHHAPTGGGADRRRRARSSAYGPASSTGSTAPA